MKLHGLQAVFAEALVQPRSIAREGAWPARAEAAFTGSERLSPIEQLDVYREQFWLRHVACLAEDCPALHALVGHEAFETLVAEYLAVHPPVHFALRYLGDKLAGFLSAKDALLGDLARVEWAFVDAFDAPDAPPLDPQNVAAIPESAWAGARIALHPSVQRLRLAHPAHKMREQFRRTQAIERASPELTRVVVYRRDDLLDIEEMDAPSFDMLDRLARGETLGAAGDAVARRHPDIEARIGEWFARWAALRWISRVEV